jgi:hypothetical protein
MNAMSWFLLGLFIGWTPAFVVLAILLARASEAREP